MSQPSLLPAQSFSVVLPGRDRLALEITLDHQGQIAHAKLTGQGCPELLQVMKTWRSRLQGPLSEVALPIGDGHAAVMMRELILRAQGKWQPPCRDDELCHCRSVPTRVVDEAIVAGAHSSPEVSRQTSASTGCGTCRPTVEQMIAYRLQKSVMSK